MLHIYFQRINEIVRRAKLKIEAHLGFILFIFLIQIINNNNKIENNKTKREELLGIVIKSTRR